MYTAAKSAIIKFWRLKAKVGIDDEGNLLYESKKEVKKSEIKKLVTKTFVKNKFGGHCKIQARAADGRIRWCKQERSSKSHQ